MFRGFVPDMADAPSHGQEGQTLSKCLVVPKQYFFPQYLCLRSVQVTQLFAEHPDINTLETICSQWVFQVLNVWIGGYPKATP